jgi:hypothetical protein
VVSGEAGLVGVDRCRTGGSRRLGAAQGLRRVDEVLELRGVQLAVGSPLGGRGAGGRDVGETGEVGKAREVGEVREVREAGEAG